MAKVPTEYATAAVKAYLAECIPKAAAQGHTNHNELVAAAADQIQIAASLFTQTIGWSRQVLRCTRP